MNRCRLESQSGCILGVVNGPVTVGQELRRYYKDHDRLNTAGPFRLRFHLRNARLYSYAVQ